MKGHAGTKLADFAPRDAALEAEIIAGLRATPRTLPPKYFYDERGSQLFEQITQLPEYYPTRTEIGIMQNNIAEIVRRAGHRASLIEFGSGSSTKTRILLDHLEELAAYVPVEISRDHLLATVAQLAADYPHIEMLPVFADFTQRFDLPEPKVMPVKNIVFFPGSTIGNFAPEQAVKLMRVMAEEAKAGGALLIGVDLKKDHGTLEAAYNDAQGVTAEFNLNMLKRLNREMSGTFVLANFEHKALYNSLAGRIEMHLISRCDQRFSVAGETFSIAKGETIRTECSYKFTNEEFAALASAAGFSVAAVWTDDEQLFSVQYLNCISS